MCCLFLTGTGGLKAFIVRPFSYYSVILCSNSVVQIRVRKRRIKRIIKLLFHYSFFAGLAGFYQMKTWGPVQALENM
jgi:hypothetical protein